MNRRLFNVPNLLTVTRIAILPLLAFLISEGQGLWACVILVVAGLTDIADGWYARKFKQETPIGKLLDPVADKVLLCVALIFLVGRNSNPLSPSLATLLLAREFLVTGLRAMAAAEGLVIGAGGTGKLKTFAQFVGLGALMLEFDPFGLPSHVIGIVALWISIFLSYLSMLQYMQLAFLELKSKMR
jgi:CDP-diacylglycerol--glycerol-3-phosphate 3-phosphatidyltransferase